MTSKRIPILLIIAITTILLISHSKADDTSSSFQQEPPPTSHHDNVEQLHPRDELNIQHHSNQGHHTVNNDNEHHKELYKKNHQPHQQPSTTSRVLELSDRFLEIVNNVLPPPPPSPGASSASVNNEPRYQPWLVMFYAPWCGHCKRLEPIFNHVAQALHNTPIRVGRIDCTRFPNVGNEYKIHGYPTIMFISGPTTRHTFTGDRELSQITNFATRMSSPPVTISPLPLNKFLTKHSKVYSPDQFIQHEDNPVRFKRRAPPTQSPTTTTASPSQQDQEQKPAQQPQPPAEHKQWVINGHIVPPLLFGIIKPTNLKSKLTDAFRTVASKYQQHNEFYEFEHSTASSKVIIFVLKANRIVLFNHFQDDSKTNITNELESWVGQERFQDFQELTRSSLHQIFSEPIATTYSKNLIVAAVVGEDKLGRVLGEEERKLLRVLRNVCDDAVGKSLGGNAAEKEHESIFGSSPPYPITTAQITETYAWIGSPDLANSIVAEHLSLPSLLIIEKSSTPSDPHSHNYYVFNDDDHSHTHHSLISSESRISNIIELIREGGSINPRVNAGSWSFRLYRWIFDVRVSLIDMWRGNPILLLLLFGLPLGFLSLILYSVCCGDIMDAKDDDDELDYDDDEVRDGDEFDGDEGFDDDGDDGDGDEGDGEVLNDVELLRRRRRNKLLRKRMRGQQQQNRNHPKRE